MGHYRPPGRGVNATFKQINTTDIQGNHFPNRQSEELELNTLNLDDFAGNYRRGLGEIGERRTVRQVNCSNE